MEFPAVIFYQRSFFRTKRLGTDSSLKRYLITNKLLQKRLDECPYRASNLVNNVVGSLGSSPDVWAIAFRVVTQSASGGAALAHFACRDFRVAASFSRAAIADAFVSCHWQQWKGGHAALLAVANA
jgi:hypothetical protein